MNLLSRQEDVLHEPFRMTDDTWSDIEGDLSTATHETDDSWIAIGPYSVQGAYEVQQRFKFLCFNTRFTLQDKRGRLFHWSSRRYRKGLSLLGKGDVTTVRLCGWKPRSLSFWLAWASILSSILLIARFCLYIEAALQTKHETFSRRSLTQDEPNHAICPLFITSSTLNMIRAYIGVLEVVNAGLQSAVANVVRTMKSRIRSHPRAPVRPERMHRHVGDIDIDIDSDEEERDTFHINPQRPERRNHDGSSTGASVAFRFWSWEPRRIDWCAAMGYFAGTSIFSLNCVFACILLPTANPKVLNILLWIPSLVGCGVNLLSSYLAIAEVAPRWWWCQARSLTWWIIHLNLLGDLLFFVAVLISPVQYDMTGLGLLLTASLIFLLSSYLLLPEMFTTTVKRPERRHTDVRETGLYHLTARARDLAAKASERSVPSSQRIGQSSEVEMTQMATPSGPQLLPAIAPRPREPQLCDAPGQ